MSTKYPWINQINNKATCDICGGISIWPYFINKAAPNKDFYKWGKKFKQQHKKCRHLKSFKAS